MVASDFRIIGNRLRKYLGDKSIVIVPCGVRIICRNCFRGNSNLRCVILPSSVLTIAQSAFKDCDNLETVIFSNNLTYIGRHSFRRCKNLCHISLHDNLGYIGSYAFHGCEKLVGNTISGMFIVPAGLKYLGPSAFSYSGIQRLEYRGRNIERLRDNVFSSCKRLLDVNLKNSGIKVFGRGIFKNCSCLNSINLPKELKSLGNTDFQFCNNIEQISLPATLEIIGYKCFYGCFNIRQINVTGNLTTIGDFAFDKCTQLAELNLTNTKIVSIGYGSFKNCIRLKSLYLPSTLNSIGNWAFPFRLMEKLKLPEDCSVGEISPSGTELRNKTYIYEYDYYDDKDLKKLCFNVKGSHLNAMFTLKEMYWQENGTLKNWAASLLKRFNNYKKDYTRGYKLCISGIGTNMRDVYKKGMEVDFGVQIDWATDEIEISEIDEINLNEFWRCVTPIKKIIFKQNTYNIFPISFISVGSSKWSGETMLRMFIEGNITVLPTSVETFMFPISQEDKAKQFKRCFGYDKVLLYDDN